MVEAQEDPLSHFSHFGEEANEFELLEEVFRTYGETGTGRTRTYVHNDEQAEQWDCLSGTFTDWRSLKKTQTYCSTRVCTERLPMIRSTSRSTLI